MNLASQLEQYLPPRVLELLTEISEEADRLGQKVYLVGGVVRDLLLGQANFDLDLVVEGDAVRLAQRMAGGPQTKLVTHPRFGTAKLGYGDFSLDMASARRETYASPGALPEVSPGTLSDDLSRRDFTINAMSVCLTPKDYAVLIDPYDGKGDLEHGLIRVLHSRSFIDDATRILRAVRYEQRLGFGLEAATAELLVRDISMLGTISPDRIRHELELILREEYPERAVARLGELGALYRISPYLQGNGWIAERFGRARALKGARQLPSLYLCLVAYRLNKEEGEDLIRHLNLPKSSAQVLRDALRLKGELRLLDRPSVKRSAVYRLLHDYHPAAIQANAVASDSPVACSNLELFLARLRYVRTALDGEKLMGLGIPAGPELGRVLQELHRAKLDGEVRTRGDEERLALSLKP